MGTQFEGLMSGIGGQAIAQQLSAIGDFRPDEGLRQLAPQMMQYASQQAFANTSRQAEREKLEYKRQQTIQTAKILAKNMGVTDPNDPQQQDKMGLAYLFAQSENPYEAMMKHQQAQDNLIGAEAVATNVLPGDRYSPGEQIGLQQLLATVPVQDRFKVATEYRNNVNSAYLVAHASDVENLYGMLNDPKVTERVAQEAIVIGVNPVTQPEAFNQLKFDYLRRTLTQENPRLLEALSNGNPTPTLEQMIKNYEMAQEKALTREKTQAEIDNKRADTELKKVTIPLRQAQTVKAARPPAPRGGGSRGGGRTSRSGPSTTRSSAKSSVVRSGANYTF